MKIIFDNIRDNIAEHLSRSNSEILIAMAWFTDRLLYGIVQEKVSKGIVVKILLNDDDINRGKLDFEYLLNAGAEVLWVKVNDDKKNMLHHKFCIIDKSIVISGSYNWTFKASQRKGENVNIIDDAEVVNQFVEEFEVLYCMHGKASEGVGATVIDDCGILLHTNPLMFLLQKQIKFLQFMISHVEERIITAKADVDYYYSMYYKYVGELVAEVLILKERLAEQLYKKTERNKEQEEYKKTKEERENYHRTKERIEKEVKEKIEIGEEQKKTLKELYKEAIRKVHPDIYPDATPEELNRLNKITAQLNKAHNSNDIENLRMLYDEIMSGVAFIRDVEMISDEAKLRTILEKLQSKYDELIVELCTIESTAEYIESKEVKDWEKHFAKMRLELEARIKAYKKQLIIDN